MTKDEALKLALEALETAMHPWEKEAAITAIKEALAQPEQEKDWGAVAEKHLAALKQSSKAITEDAAVRAVHRMAQPEQSQVEETLRYEIDALEAKLAECRAQQQEPVIGTKTWFEDGKVVTQHLTAKDIYKEPEPVIDKSAAVRIATSLGWEPKRKPLSEERIDDIWNLHCDEMGYVSVSDAVELARDFEAAHGIKVDTC